jgi:hypothetical protein
LIDKYPSAYDYVKLKDRNEFIKLLSKTYHYNSTIANIFIYTLLANKFKHVQSFIPIPNKVLNDTNILENSIKKKAIVADLNKEKYLQEIIETCRNKNIKLFFVNSPYYRKTANNNYYNSFGKKVIKILNENNVDFIDFTNDSNFLSQSKYFADLGHLNADGADLFSEKIAYIINNKNLNTILNREF